MKTIDIEFNSNYLDLGFCKSIIWNPSTTPHAVIIGSTGSGKTFFTKLLLGKLSLHIPDLKLIVCDYEGDDDFSFLNNLSDFYRFESCNKGLDKAHDKLKQRQSGTDSSRNMVMIVFDEWASYCNSLEKRHLKKKRKNYQLYSC